MSWASVTLTSAREVSVRSRIVELRPEPGKVYLTMNLKDRSFEIKEKDWLVLDDQMIYGVSNEYFKRRYKCNTSSKSLSKRSKLLTKTSKKSKRS